MSYTALLARFRAHARAADLTSPPRHPTATTHHRPTAPPPGRSSGRGSEGGAGRVACVVAGVVVVVLGVVGVGVGPMVTIGFGLCLVWWWRRRSAGGEAARQAQLPEALERMAAALRTGSSVQQALADAARSVDPPLGLELADMAAATTRGRPLAEVVDEWARRRSDRGTRLVATALVLATAVGAAPARALDGVAATMRERLELAGERRALATQAQASAVVLSVAPVGFAVLLCASDPAVARFLVGTTAGWLCLLAGIGLDALGAFWMSRLTKAVVR